MSRAMKRFFLIISCCVIAINVCADEITPIPLPPMISPKQNQSVEKIQKSEAPPPILPKTESIIENTPPPLKKKPQVTLPSIQLKIGVNRADGGIYTPLASTICIFKNEDNSNACRIFQYDDAVKAMFGLLNGDVDVLLTSSVFGKLAVDGIAPFDKNMQYKKIRFVTSFFNEDFIVIARRDSKIKQLNDLNTSSIDIGKTYTRTRMVFDDLMKLKTWTNSSFKQVTEMSPDDQIKTICNGSVQAIAIVGEDMNDQVKKVTRACEVNILGLSEDELNLFKNNSAYVKDKIEGGKYVGMPRDIDTIAVKAVFLTTSDISGSEIESLMNVLQIHLKEIKLLHYGLNNITIEGMLNEGRIAQMHDGVLSFVEKNKLSDKIKP